MLPDSKQLIPSYTYRLMLALGRHSGLCSKRHEYLLSGANESIELGLVASPCWARSTQERPKKRSALEPGEGGTFLCLSAF